MKIAVYDVRLVRSRRALTLSEPSVGSPTQAASALHALIGKTDREHLAVLFLDNQHTVTGAHIAAIGAQSECRSEPRTLFRAAVLACAAGIILGHNHPSGNPEPSENDLATTRAWVNAADVLGIPILDHIIVTRHPLRYESMLSRGMLPSAAPVGMR